MLWAKPFQRNITLQQLLNVWLSLEPSRRIFVALATIGMFVAVLTLSNFATKPTMSLLYSGLETGAAGDVVRSLDQRGEVFEIRSGSIFVESRKRDELRMTLAAEGLPASNGQGYELLDTLSGFGTTAQMFDATYWRAKEGELARTISSGPSIQTARVHISNSPKQAFQRTKPMTASVTIVGTNGAISAANAKAARYLVASAVANLEPSNVSVIDGKNGVVVPVDGNSDGAMAGTDIANILKKNVERLLAARVGINNSVVEVNIETVNERESLIEHTFDPESRVAISSDTEERTTNSNDSGSGSVTVASNLPAGDEGGSGSTSSSQNNETRERINFEVSEITREVLRTPGAIKRLSVAVLIDGTTTLDPETGADIWVARDPAELAELTELVSSVVGYNAERGDTVTVKSMEFASLPETGTVAKPSLLQTLNLDVMRIFTMGVLAVVSIVIGMFVVRPVMLSAAAITAKGLPAPATNHPPVSISNQVSPPMGSTGSSSIASNVLTGEIQDSPIPATAAPIGRSAKASNDVSANPQLTNDPVDRLRDLISDRQEETVEVLRSWMEDEEGVT